MLFRLFAISPIYYFYHPKTQNVTAKFKIYYFCLNINCMFRTTLAAAFFAAVTKKRVQNAKNCVRINTVLQRGAKVEMEIIDIFAHATEQEREFVRELVEGVYVNFRKQALSRLNYDEDLADDVLLTMYETALRRAHIVAHHEHPEAWLAKTLSHCIKRKITNIMKKSGHDVTFVSIDVVGDLLPDPQEINDIPDVTDAEIEHAKEQILSQLTPLELATYKLRYEENLPTKEIAERLGVSDATIRARLYRINIKIKMLADNIFS